MTPSLKYKMKYPGIEKVNKNISAEGNKNHYYWSVSWDNYHSGYWAFVLDRKSGDYQSLWVKEINKIPILLDICIDKIKLRVFDTINRV